MKYENPEIEIVELRDTDIIITSLGDGGTSTESPDGPSVGWD